MAEPTDRSAPPTGVTNTAPAAQDGGFSPELPRASDSLPVYRPLSLLALIGFCGAVIYAIVVALGAVAAFMSGKPFLQDLWMALFPLAIVALCALGLLHVKRSEGTMAGSALGRWGLWLTAIVGLGYWAYYGTTRYAVSSEADRVGRTFLEKLSRGQTDSAFRLTLEPGQRRPDDANLREDLETRFNTPGSDGKGALAKLEDADLARLLRLYGPDATIESRGVSDFKHMGDRYWVTLDYHVTGIYGSFDASVLAQSAEGHKKQLEGRGWHIDSRACRVAPEARELSPEGERLPSQFRDEALRRRSADWFSAMREGRLDEAFLATLKPEERRPLQQEFACRRLAAALAVDGGAMSCATPAAPLVRAFLVTNNEATRELFLPGPGYRDFLNGDLVHEDVNGFWSEPQDREAILAAVKRGFRYPSRREELVRGLTPEPLLIPRVRIEGDRFLYEEDFVLRISAPAYLVQGYLIFDCDLNEWRTGPVSDWRLRSIELLRGRKPATSPPGRGGAQPGQ